MASAEQPLKKRKLYEQFRQSSPSLSQQSPTPSPQPPPPAWPPAQPLTQEEIIRRKVNLEEIRKVCNCLKQIKCCIAKEEEDPRHMPELGQAYLSLITASRGCLSVQRIVADLIPRYASYCPTALEAAAKVIINMYNCSLVVISSGEDLDGIAFDTAEACILGLVDISQAAVKDAPTSSVIQVICSAVFLNVIAFFISSFEGKDIFQIIDMEILKIQDVKEFNAEFKQKFLDEGHSSLLKLSKFCAASILRIFFSCPKYSIAACFELFESTTSTTDSTHLQNGYYFLHQLTKRLGDAVSYPLTHLSHGDKSTTGSTGISCRGKDVLQNELVPEGNHVSRKASPASWNCLLGLVLQKDPSLKTWIFSRFRKLRKSACMQVVSDITSVLEEIFESFVEEIKGEDTRADGDGSESSETKYINQYLAPREPSQLETSSDIIGKDYSSKGYDKCCPENTTNKNFSAFHLKKSSSYHSSASSTIDNGASRSMDFDFGGGDSSLTRSSVPRDLLNQQVHSLITRTPVDLRSPLQGLQREKNQVSTVEPFIPSLTACTEGVNCSFDSPKHHLPLVHPSTNQFIWHSDSDPGAMDIFPASKQLWLGSLGPDASEGLVRCQFEKFGPVDEFLYCSFKGFALIEYRNILDAIKAREVMRGRSPWGACLRVKFLDAGLGTKGSINGIDVGSSCHVYVGHVSSQWVKDEILNEIRKVLHKGPRVAIDLHSDSAFLVEFDAPEEATIAMSHLRRCRSETDSPLLLTNLGLKNGIRHAYSTGPGSAVVDLGSSYSSNKMIESSQTQAGPDNPSDFYLARMSRLSKILLQLRTKYNLTRSPAYSDNCRTGSHQFASTREERPPSCTLWINIPNLNPMFLTDDELLAVCNLAINNVESVVKLRRTNTPTGSSWVLECNSIDTARMLLDNLRDCPGLFFQIEYSHPGKHHNTPLPVKPESNLELTSPRGNPENLGTLAQVGHVFRAKWTPVGHKGMPEFGSRNPDNMFVDPSLGGSPVVSNSAERMWMYRRHEPELHSGPAGISCIPAPTLGPRLPPPRAVRPPPFQPFNFPPSSSWDARGFNNHRPGNPISSGVMPNMLSMPNMPNIRHNPVPPPFIPASVTPLAQLQGTSMSAFDQMFSVPVVTPRPVISPLPASQPDVQPPLPPSQPPPPYSKPPLVPPPPNSPSPPPPSQYSNLECSKLSAIEYQWQGTLSKSGVPYCTVYAQRADSDICKYADEISEPAEWPDKLDMTKRTDFRHVKATFSNTPPHKREICWLHPTSQGDHAGFQDFISYLQQRECAGVIKIPAVKSMWGRLLFILPYSLDTCCMLSIAPKPSLCLIGLVMPKETNFEWV